MDRSKKYIKMSEKSPLRKFWEPQSGDFVYCPENGKVVVLYFNEHHGSPPEKYTNKDTAIPLFRQDQLQEMIIRAFCDWTDLFDTFTTACFEMEGLESPEQYWHAFAVFWLHLPQSQNMSWTGTDWQPAEEENNART